MPTLETGMQACGSGGTAAGLALGLHLSALPWRLHAMGVCDDPTYFYGYIDGLLKGMGVDHASLGTLSIHIHKCHAVMFKSTAGFAFSMLASTWHIQVGHSFVHSCRMANSVNNYSWRL